MTSFSIPGWVTPAIFVALGMMWALRRWIGAQVSRGISYAFDTRLETHKAQLKSEGEVVLESLRSQLRVESDKEVDQYRSMLRVQGDRELAALRAALDSEASKRHIVHVELTRRRFDAIAAVHTALLRLFESVKQLVDPTARDGVSTDDECVQAVWKASQTFDDQYRDQRIFLRKTTSDRIANIRQMLISNANLFHLHVKNPANPTPTESWLTVYQAMSNSVPEAIDALEWDLRSLMGDHER
jgi:hypothetical protein